MMTKENVGISKASARMVGLLFLVATATYMIGSGLLASVMAVPDYLAQVYPNQAQVFTGALLQLVDTAAVVAIGLIMFPILKRHSPTLALSYVATRVLECAFLAAGAIKSLALIPLSAAYLQAGAADSGYFETLGALYQAESLLNYQVGMAVLGLGSIFFCYLLYTSKLIPRALSLLALIGYVALLCGALLEMAGYGFGLWFYIPGGLFELILPFWLFVKGFNSSVSAVEVDTATSRDDMTLVQA